MERGARKRQPKMVLVEQFRHEGQLVREGYELLNQKVDRLDQKIDRVEGTLIARMDAGFAEVVKVVGEFATRLDSHERAHAS